MNQNNNPKKDIKNPSVLKIIVKLIFVLFAFYCLFSIIAFTIQYFAESSYESTDESKMIRNCDTYFYEKDYFGLYSELSLYDLNDSKYDMYWEAANGYMDYSQYIQFKKAVEKGDKDSEKWLEEYKKKVLENAENCEFEENVKQLDGYAEEIKQSI